MENEKLYIDIFGLSPKDKAQKIKKEYIETNYVNDSWQGSVFYKDDSKAKKHLTDYVLGQLETADILIKHNVDFGRIIKKYYKEVYTYINS